MAAKTNMNAATTTRLALLKEHTRAIMATWAESPASGIDDPVVVVVDPRGGDTLARELSVGKVGRVGLVSARAMIDAHGKSLAQPVADALRTLRPNALFVMCVAAGGTTAGYVRHEPSTGRLRLSM